MHKYIERETYTYTRFFIFSTFQFDFTTKTYQRMYGAIFWTIVTNYKRIHCNYLHLHIIFCGSSRRWMRQNPLAHCETQNHAFQQTNFHLVHCFVPHHLSHGTKSYASLVNHFLPHYSSRFCSLQKIHLIQCKSHKINILLCMSIFRNRQKTPTSLLIFLHNKIF